MDINMTIRVPAIEKLQDMTASGFGATVGTYLKPWIAAREAEAQRRMAQGQADSMRILAQAQADSRELILPQDAITQGELSFSTILEQKVLYQEEKRTNNALTTVHEAARELGDEDVPDVEPDHDWTAQFFAGVQDVSSEDLKLLWAKMLAEQVRHPGSTSIKTLNILRTLDNQVAKLFQRLCSLSISLIAGTDIIDARVPTMGGKPGDNSLLEYGLGFRNLVTLEEYGLISSEYRSWIDCQICVRWQGMDRPTIPFSFQGRNWMLEPVADSQQQQLRIEGVALTGSGRELSRIVELERMDEFSQSLRQHFTSLNMHMTNS